jgi:iron-sulfur cluster assembly protein
MVKKMEQTQAVPIQITERAIRRMKQLIAKQTASEIYLRIGVRAGGCAGLEYVLRLEETRKATDQLFEVDGIAMIMDPKSAQILQGSTLDFTGELLGGGFRFRNPGAKRGCGCGTSFSPV